jgi:thiosulfate/3-mercaptopyruvate sulfurtransferase
MDENSQYACPEVLVSTDWVEANLNSTNIRIVESNEDQLLYKSGHIPGAVEIDWIRDLNDPIKRDFLDKNNFEEMMSRYGITNNSTVVFYGDKNNWWSCYAFWIFKLFGHQDCKIIDGGRIKWEQEKKALSREVPQYLATTYNAPPRDDSKYRVFKEQVLRELNSNPQLVDVRSIDEYTGAKLHMEGYPQEGALRGGHIPGAKSLPWSIAANTTNGTFKSLEELKKIYIKDAGLNPTKDTIAYCRIGERSAHTWFVLTYLLGFDKVKNYDGSWTEWGNSVGVPIEKD